MQRLYNFTEEFFFFIKPITSCVVHIYPQEDNDSGDFSFRHAPRKLFTVILTVLETELI